MQVTLMLRPGEADVLRKLAHSERRTPRAQAAVLLAEALNQQAQQPTKETVSK